MLTKDISKKLFLLDAYALIYRAYFAFSKNPRINSKGQNTSAAFGFTNALIDILNREKPTHIAVVFDPPGGATQRQEEFSEYKANREKMPEDIREMILPGAIPLVVPVFVGFLFGPEVLGGLLAGVTVSGVLMGVFQNNAGGAWDNAKKSMEASGEKGSDSHKASVTGDTVGDPFKDTSGPSMNILIKLMSIVSLVIAPHIRVDDSAHKNTHSFNDGVVVEKTVTTVEFNGGNTNNTVNY